MNLAKRESRARHRDYYVQKSREYNELHRDSMVESSRNYYREHRAELLSKKRLKHIENPSINRVRNKRWRDANPEKCRYYNRKYKLAKTHNRRAREKAGGKFTLKEWQDVKNKFGRCVCCGDKNIKLVPDHVVSLYTNGANTIDNIQPLCQQCNGRKWIKCLDYRQGWLNKPEGDIEVELEVAA